MGYAGLGRNTCRLRTKIKDTMCKKILRILLILLVIVTLPYYFTVLYNFPESKPFSGDTFYNPYQGIGETWLKCNFHAHSIKMGGLTNGNNTIDEMAARYTSYGYDVAALSNYNAVTGNTNGDSGIYIPAYEHGINLGTIHQLVINSPHSFLFDYPFFQLLSHKQFVINKLRNNNALIVIAHPSFKSAYAPEDFTSLTNYDIVEAVSVRAMSLKHWDAALSSGHAVWGLASDDAHDTTKHHCGLCWNMVNVKEKTPANLIESLKAGRYYFTKGWMGQEMHHLKSLTVENNTYTLLLNQKADTLQLFADNGRQVAIATNTDSLSYTIRPEDTYLRAEIFETEVWNNYTRTYLNPVIRCSNNQLPTAFPAKVSIWKTVLYIFVLLCFHGGLVYRILRINN